MQTGGTTHLNSSRCNVAEPTKPLKILVASTPKTGNTWVKFLLAELYDLSIRSFPLDPGEIDWGALNDSWIGHQHYLPSDGLLKTLKAKGVHVVTSVRHPADTFVSLFHHVQKEATTSDRMSDAGYIRHDGGMFGQHALDFLRNGFPEHLHLSRAWSDSGLAKIVRYEALCDNPVETLSSLARSIRPMPRQRIRETIGACEIEAMRKRYTERKTFFRRGGTGGWYEELPESFCEVLATHPPYPEQFAALGYALPVAATTDAPSWQAPAKLPHPFRESSSFDNGVPVVPILIRLFFEADETFSRKWKDLSVGPGSFWDWLNQPTRSDQDSCGQFPIVTELAYAIYQRRPDVRAVFPDIFGKHRALYCEWFLTHGLKAYGLSDCFGLPLFRRNAEAARGSNPPFPLRVGEFFQDGTPIPAIAIRIYYSLPAAQTKLWKDPLSVTSNSFFQWLKSAARADPFAAERRTRISELAWQVYLLRGDVQRCYPDIFGADRDHFANWFRECAAIEHAFSSAFLEPAAPIISQARDESNTDSESSGWVSDLGSSADPFFESQRAHAREGSPPSARGERRN